MAFEFCADREGAGSRNQAPEARESEAVSHANLSSERKDPDRGCAHSSGVGGGAGDLSAGRASSSSGSGSVGRRSERIEEVSEPADSGRGSRRFRCEVATPSSSFPLLLNVHHLLGTVISMPIVGFSSLVAGPPEHAVFKRDPSISPDGKTLTIQVLPTVPPSRTCLR